jgi:hypothetical protein
VERIVDEDDLLCGGGDDEVDVNPDAADRLVRLHIDLATRQLRFLDPTLTRPAPSWAAPATASSSGAPTAPRTGSSTSR